MPTKVTKARERRLQALVGEEGVSHALVDNATWFDGLTTEVTALGDAQAVRAARALYDAFGHALPRHPLFEKAGFPAHEHTGVDGFDDDEHEATWFLSIMCHLSEDMNMEQRASVDDSLELRVIRMVGQRLQSECLHTTKTMGM